MRPGARASPRNAPCPTPSLRRAQPRRQRWSGKISPRHAGTVDASRARGCVLEKVTVNSDDRPCAKTASPSSMPCGRRPARSLTFSRIRRMRTHRTFARIAQKLTPIGERSPLGSSLGADVFDTGDPPCAIAFSPSPPWRSSSRAGLAQARDHDHPPRYAGRGSRAARQCAQDRRDPRVR